MAQRSEILTVYAAGMVQGIALVTFPAAGAVFTSASDYGLSSTQYGGMFVPQAIMAIVASLLGAGLRSRLGTKRIYLLGLIANLLAMALLVLSRFVMKDHSLAYGILLVATTCMGIGFGFTVPALNTFAAAFFPQKVDKAVLALNALLGLGTALAPVFIAVFVGLGIWWGLPILVSALIIGLLLFSFRQPLNEGDSSSAKTAKKAKFPVRFWVFAAFALLYGVCETMNGNWAALYLKENFGASTALASLALTLFWAMVTAGRILFAAIGKWVPEPVVCRILPLVVTAALIASACAPKTNALLGILTFALAGLGCSALLPLTISFGQKELTTIAASVAGGLIAFYQIGYGIAAFGVGPLQSAGWDLHRIYGATAVVALALSALSFVVARAPRAPA
ncbi:MAG TPA: MFS transporter [Candidatus Acidoferrales bacterium]|jgi:MFS family permease|nr:MFS transporter [Candidatus Acidoferrales bacterium]